MLISFSATQSTGKTTLLNELRTDKSLSKYTFIDEITRSIHDKGYAINELGNDETQEIIMNAHIQNAKHKNAIMDRCALDGLCYTEYLYNAGQVSYNTLKYAQRVFIQLIDKYDIIFYLTPEFRNVRDGVRSNSESFRNDVAELFECNIRKYNIDV